MLQTTRGDTPVMLYARPFPTKIEDDVDSILESGTASRGANSTGDGFTWKHVR